MNEKPKLKRMSANLTEFRITPPKLKSKRRFKSLRLVLKSFACVLAPLIVPTIVYGVEGCSTLFWWILGIASVTSLLLLVFDVQKAKDLLEYLKIDQCGGMRCIVRIGLILLTCGLGTYAYHEHFYEIFSVCLFTTGVITGTFYSDITTWWNFRTKKNLPYVNFTKDSPKPVRPSFLDLRRKSFNIPDRAKGSLPLKRQFSSPIKQSSDARNYPTLKEVEIPDPPLSAETPTTPKTKVVFGYPSTSSSSCDSDVPDAPNQSMVTTPTKRRVIAAENISLSPIMNKIEKSPLSNRQFEFSGSRNPTSLQPPDVSFLETPTFTYTNCSVESLMSQNFSFFHM